MQMDLSKAHYICMNGVYLHHPLDNQIWKLELIKSFTKRISLRTPIFFQMEESFVWSSLAMAGLSPLYSNKWPCACFFDSSISSSYSCWLILMHIVSSSMALNGNCLKLITSIGNCLCENLAVRNFFFPFPSEMME